MATLTISKADSSHRQLVCRQTHTAEEKVKPHLSVLYTYFFDLHQSGRFISLPSLGNHRSSNAATAIARGIETWLLDALSSHQPMLHNWMVASVLKSESDLASTEYDIMTSIQDWLQTGEWASSVRGLGGLEVELTAGRVASEGCKLWMAREAVEYEDDIWEYLVKFPWFIGLRLQVDPDASKMDDDTPATQYTFSFQYASVSDNREEDEWQKSSSLLGDVGTSLLPGHELAMVPSVSLVKKTLSPKKFLTPTP